MPLRTTTVTPAGALRPSDLLIGPHTAKPVRVLWSCDLTSPGQIRLELSDGRRLLLDCDDPVVITTRPGPGDPEWCERYATALRGASLEHALLESFPPDPVRTALLALVTRRAARWAFHLAMLTGEPPSAILTRYHLM